MIILTEAFTLGTKRRDSAWRFVYLENKETRKEIIFKKLRFNSDPAWHLVLERAARRFRHIPAGSLFSDRA